MSANTLRDLFIDELKDIYDAEQRLTKALPKMVKAANSEELATAFEDHLAETEEHVARLERVIKMLDEAPTRKTCKAMVGLLEEGQELMSEEGPPDVKDAALIAAAQKVEHYEIATYGCLRTWADNLGENEASELLSMTLDEEAAADERLNEIASTLNADAAEEEEESDENKVMVGRRASVVNRATEKSRKG